uniref:Uncharacterized protein n=1 Tax=Meloidogyne enterolobii TaxID=390850 RepID=A0A6V7U2J1_MELEN|nr:unnamed protein product [Meloidogyne enterolobii]
MIRTIYPNLNPDSISVDFELAIHNAIRTIFPESHIRGRFFHLFSNLKKHLSSLNLINHYNTNPKFALNSRMIVSLAFAPQNDLLEALNILENYLLLNWNLFLHISQILILVESVITVPVLHLHLSPLHGMSTNVQSTTKIRLTTTVRRFTKKFNCSWELPILQFGSFWMN